MSMRAWRRRLRLFKAIELLAGHLNVTQIALELGYSSHSARKWVVAHRRTGLVWDRPYDRPPGASLKGS